MKDVTMPKLFKIIFLFLVLTLSPESIGARETRFHILAGLHKNSSVPTIQIGVSKSTANEIVKYYFFGEYFIKEPLPLALNASATIQLWEGNIFLFYFSGGGGWRGHYASPLMYALMTLHVGSGFMYNINENVYVELNFRQYWRYVGSRNRNVEKIYYSTGLGIAIDLPRSNRKR